MNNPSLLGITRPRVLQHSISEIEIVWRVNAYVSRGPVGALCGKARVESNAINFEKGFSFLVFVRRDSPVMASVER